MMSTGRIPMPPPPTVYPHSTGEVLQMEYLSGDALVPNHALRNVIEDCLRREPVQ